MLSLSLRQQFLADTVLDDDHDSRWKLFNYYSKNLFGYHLLLKTENLLLKSWR